MFVILLINLEEEGRREEEEEEEDCVNLFNHSIVCYCLHMCTIGNQRSWPNILSRITKYISSTSALFDIGLLIFRGASHGLKPGHSITDKKVPCSVINKQVSVAGRNYRNFKVTVKKPSGSKLSQSSRPGPKHSGGGIQSSKRQT